MPHFHTCEQYKAEKKDPEPGQAPSKAYMEGHRGIYGRVEEDAP